MRRRARGIVGLVVLSLGLGVVTTYGVAWGLMNKRNEVLLLWNQPPPDNDIAGWFVFMGTHSGAQWLEAEGRWENPDSRTARFDGAGREENPLQVPAWSLVHRVSPNEFYPGWQDADPARCTFWERAAGWPLLAIVEREVGMRPGLWPTRPVGASIRIGGDGDRWSGVVIAMAPVWSGFAIDAVVYGSFWAALLIGIRAIRYGLRMRRGQCPKCRYDLSGLTGGMCPECGIAVKGT